MRAVRPFPALGPVRSHLNDAVHDGLRHRRCHPEGNPTGSEKRRYHACSPHLFLLSTYERSAPMASRGAVCSHEQGVPAQRSPSSWRLVGWTEAGASRKRGALGTRLKNRVPLRTAMNKTSISMVLAG